MMVVHIIQIKLNVRKVIHAPIIFIGNQLKININTKAIIHIEIDIYVTRLIEDKFFIIKSLRNTLFIVVVKNEKIKN